ncbi:MAG: DegT/DnrJ/EryC1/StrS family aminotransferase, partial [Anaerolineales bacterium]
EIVSLYRAQLGEIDGLSIPYRDHPGISAAHLFPILLDNAIDRAFFIDSMKEKGIQTSIHYPPIHTFTYYRQTFGEIELSNTEEVGRREVTLPLYPTMTNEQIGWVVEAVCESLEVAKR